MGSSSTVLKHSGQFLVNVGWKKMSLVTLQLGQCGNQIGFEFFDLLSKTLTKPASTVTTTPGEWDGEALERFFHVNENDQPLARAVMVDMEQKVIAQALHDAQKSSLWGYQKDQKVTGKKGSGNNWAQGYCCHGPQCITDVLEMVSKEAEKCDSLGGFLALMSLAGGTGSGLGAFVTTALRDEYPHCSVVNEAIWPYATGEVIVQNYNAVLTLSHLYSSSDGIIIMENEKLQKICSQLLKIKNVSFKDINKVIATKMAGILLPAHEMQGSSRFLLADILSNVCSHPGYKLLNILNIPVIPKSSLAYTSYHWKMLMKHCRQMLIANANMEEGINWDVKLPSQSNSTHLPFHKASTSDQVLTINKSLSNQLFLRGKEADQVDVSSFQDPLLYTNWVPSFGRLSTACHSVGFNDIERSVTLLSNSQTSLKPLNSVINNAWEMFASRAYVYQYTKHGISEDDFVDSFVSLEQVIKNYSSL